MQKLSLDPLYITKDLQSLRDSVQLQLNKLQDYVNILKNYTNPTGSIIGLETSVTPEGYMYADGSTFNGALYPDLQAYLGGTTLPDYRGMVLVGRKAGDPDFGTAGSVGGSKTSVATHNHLDLGHVHFHAHTITVGGSGTHNHTPAGGGSGDWAIRFPSALGGLINTGPEKITFTSTSGDGGHVHSGAALNDSTVGVSDTQPAGTSSGNLQPYKVLNWYIKT